MIYDVGRQVMKHAKKGIVYTVRTPICPSIRLSIYCMNYVVWNVHVQHLQQLRLRFKKLTAKTVPGKYLGQPLSFVTLKNLG